MCAAVAAASAARFLSHSRRSCGPGAPRVAPRFGFRAVPVRAVRADAVSAARCLLRFVAAAAFGRSRGFFIYKFGLVVFGRKTPGGRQAIVRFPAVFLCRGRCVWGFRGFRGRRGGANRRIAGGKWRLKTFFRRFFCTNGKCVLNLHPVRPLKRFTVDVAQLVRASDCGSEGRGFEPLLPPF